MKKHRKIEGESVVEPKVDGVYARVTRDGMVTKTGKPVRNQEHVRRALRGYFKRHPKGVVEGDLHRRGQTFEKTLGKFRGGDGVRGRRLKLYVHGEERPGVGETGLTGWRHVRRVKGKVVKDDAGLEKAHRRNLRKGYEGSVVKRNGEARKLKPEHDEELPVVASRVRKDGKAGVVSVRGRDGKVLRVQGSAAEVGRAKPGSRATVVYQKSSGGAVRGGRLKAVRNHDFAAGGFQSMENGEWIMEHEFAASRRSKRVVGAVRKVLAKKKVPKRVKDAVKKVPAPIRKGYVAGALVPVPGAATTGAAAGAAWMGKEAVEKAVRRKTGRPWRMFSEGSSDGGNTLEPGIYKGSRGVRRLPFFKHEYVAVVPRDKRRVKRKLRGRMADVNGQKVVVMGAYNKKGKLKSAYRDKVDVAALRKAVKSGKGLRRVGKSTDTDAALGKMAEATERHRPTAYPGFVKNVVGLGRNSNSYARSLLRNAGVRKRGEHGVRTPGTKIAVEFDTRNKGMDLEPKDVKRLKSGGGSQDAGVRKRDRLARTKDVVDIAGTGVAAGATVTGAVALRRTTKKANRLIDNANTEVGRVGREVRDAAKRTNAKSVVGEVSRRAKKRVGDAFPTVRKVARALVRKRKFFEQKMEFAGRDQLKDDKTNQYVDALKVASGQRTGYFVSDAKKKAVDLPIGHAQVIRSAYNKGKKIERTGGRAARLVRDAGDVVRGKERRKDAAGRKKKREWEKSWFKKTAGSAAAGAGVLGYAALLRKNPKIASKNKTVNKVLRKVAGKHHGRKVRTVHTETVNRAKNRVNRVIPDTFASFTERLPSSRSASAPSAAGAEFALPGGRPLAAVIDGHLLEFGVEVENLRHFDGDAARAGWDVRDPRGRSARVFAPGSRKRNRREKRWHERAENERKLWKGAVVGGVLAGAALRPASAKVVKVIQGIAKRRAMKKPVQVKSSGFVRNNKVMGSGKVSPAPRKKPDLRTDRQKRMDKFKVV